MEDTALEDKCISFIKRCSSVRVSSSVMYEWYNTVTETDELAMMSKIQTGWYCIAKTLLQQFNKPIDSCGETGQLRLSMNAFQCVKPFSEMYNKLHPQRDLSGSASSSVALNSSMCLLQLCKYH